MIRIAEAPSADPGGVSRDVQLRDAIMRKVSRGPIEWSAIQCSMTDHTGILYVASDAFSVRSLWNPTETCACGMHQGVLYVPESLAEVPQCPDITRIDITPTLAQQACDIFGTLLPTTKIADMIYEQRSVKLPCYTSNPDSQMAYTSRMVWHSDKIKTGKGDQLGLTCNVGKHWVFTNTLLQHPGMAANYGWYDTSAPYLSANRKFKVWQPLSWAHNLGHVDYCVAPETRVLRSDLTWVPAASLNAGDEVVGFDEALSRCTKYRPARVLRSERNVLECVEITTTWGTVVASVDHQWVARRRVLSRSEAAVARQKRRGLGEDPIGQSVWSWFRSEDLEPGCNIATFARPWNFDDTRDGGWMAGILDGEGWCSPPTGVGVGQNPGPVLDAILSKLTQDGFEVSVSANGGGCMRVMPTGQRASIRLLGMYRPQRLMGKARLLWDGTVAFNGGRQRENAEVLSVRPLGKCEVVAMQTSTGTLICEGMLSHNSQVLVVVGSQMIVDGKPMNTWDVLKDPALCAMLSYEGPLTIDRIPGVDPDPDSGYDLISPTA